jgi:large subunit ribosomal protein L28
MTGNSITRRGLAKRVGGVGKKTTSTTKRKFLPNLQTRRILVAGKTKKILVCTRCIKKNKLTFVAG